MGMIRSRGYEIQTSGKLGADVIVDSTKIKASAIASSDLSASCVASRHLSASCIGSEAISDKTIAAEHLSSSCVTSEKIGADAILESMITDDAVTTSKIKASAVTSTEIGADAILKDMIVNGQIDKNKLVESATTLDTLLAAGSFDSSADDNTGEVLIAHGLSTAPTAAGGTIFQTTAGVQNLGLKGIDGTNLTYCVSSCPLTTVDAVASSFTTNFTWWARL